MTTDNPPSTARIAGHPIHAMLVPFPIALFVAAFVSDIAYWRTLDVMWATFSVVMFVVALVNAFVHSRDGYTAVVPTGLILSGIVVLILPVMAWLGASMVYRHGVGVAK